MSGYRAHLSFTRGILVYLSLGLAASIAVLWVYSARPLGFDYGSALTTLNETRTGTVMYVAGVCAYVYIAVACLVFVAALIASHRICGPVYRMMRSALDAAAGDFSFRVRVRRRDHLRETAGEMDSTVGVIGQKLSDIRTTAERMRDTARAVEEGFSGPSLDEEGLARLAERLKDEKEDLEKRLSFFNT